MLENQFEAIFTGNVYHPPDGTNGTPFVVINTYIQKYNEEFKPQ